MITIYIVLILACSYMELSPKVDTENLLEKLGMGAIAFGSGLDLSRELYLKLGDELSLKFGLELSRQHTGLILFGAALYFLTIACRSCIAKHNRREDDKRKRN